MCFCVIVPYARRCPICLRSALAEPLSHHLSSRGIVNNAVEDFRRVSAVFCWAFHHQQQKAAEVNITIIRISDGIRVRVVDVGVTAMMVAKWSYSRIVQWTNRNLMGSKKSRSLLLPCEHIKFFVPSELPRFSTVANHFTCSRRTTEQEQHRESTIVTML